MQNIIRFSIFGNFERFNTNNLDMYLKLIDFLDKNLINLLQQMNYNFKLVAKQVKLG